MQLVLLDGHLLASDTCARIVSRTMHSSTCAHTRAETFYIYALGDIFSPHSGRSILSDSTGQKASMEIDEIGCNRMEDSDKKRNFQRAAGFNGNTRKTSWLLSPIILGWPIRFFGANGVEKITTGSIRGLH